MPRLTALERDETAAAVLAGKFPGVRVAVGDATATSYPDCSFDSVGSFTMLHHVPTTARQNQILAHDSCQRTIQPVSARDQALQVTVALAEEIREA